MEFALFSSTYTRAVIELFTQVFSDSAGESEGQSIGNLVSNLIAKTRPHDLIGYVAIDNKKLVGCLFFSRFIVPDSQVAFILSPVAVSTNVQGNGIGQGLIAYGLEHLRSIGVNLAFTYGDPAFYSRTGFKQISESVVQAPYVLSQPHGWLAQSLDGSPIKAMRGSTECVEALREQKYW